MLGGEDDDMRHLALLLALLVVMIFTVGSVEAGFGWASATTSTPAEASLRDDINAEHQRVCGHTMTYDPRLVTLARFRSTDMGLRGYYSHISPDGLRLGNWLARMHVSYRYAGENISWNAYPVDQSEKGVFGSWMTSAGHRHLIQDCKFTRLGVGAYRVGIRNYWTAEFLQP